MMRRRIIQAVLLCVLLSACKANPEVVLSKTDEVLSKIDEVLSTAKDIYDLYSLAQPIIAEVVKEPKPIPTFGLAKPVKDYFALASSPYCEQAIDKFDGIDPFESITCRFTDVEVRYDYWFSGTTMDKFHDTVLNLPGISKISRSTWHDNQNPEAILGNLYRFIDEEGGANLIWTVPNADLPAFASLSGWARRADGNQEGLYDWWAKEGAKHN